MLSFCKSSLRPYLSNITWVAVMPRSSVLLRSGNTIKTTKKYTGLSETFLTSISNRSNHDSSPRFRTAVTLTASFDGSIATLADLSPSLVCAMTLEHGLGRLSRWENMIEGLEIAKELDMAKSRIAALTR